MLEIQDLTYEFKRKKLLHSIHATFLPGHLYGLLGPNGSGKSTFFKAMSGIWPCATGCVRWNNQLLLNQSRLAISRVMSLVPQSPSLSFDFTVYEMVKMGRYGRSASWQEDQLKIEECLRLVDGWRLKDRLISELSGGERQRAYIARALATEAPILLLDEPTAYLDLRHQLDIWTLLKEIKLKNKIVIVALHDFKVSQRMCDEIVLLNQGRLIGKGSFQTVMTPEIIEKTFGLSIEDQLSEGIFAS